MSKDLPPDNNSLPLAAEERIDEICLRFEDAWRTGDQPRVETYLEGIPEPQRSLLFQELLRLELYYQQQSGRQGRFLPGVVLADRFRIVSLLGRGGMGEVYRADDMKLGQPVALKFLPEGLAGDPQFLDLFYNEVRLARQVAHPNVCRVYDIGDVEGQHFLSMEYVDGEDLARLLKRIGRLPPDRGIAISRQLCAGLAAAHAAGIVHRDLKPANVMLDSRGRARITDFGLACLTTAPETREVFAGTPLYMAPEQLAGEQATVHSDIFALGLLICELFTGRLPFDADTARDPMQTREQAAPIRPSQFIKDLDPAVERVILGCLEDEPRDRPSSVEVVMRALPGRDPLDSALAAGHTPSPDMVAAAGDAGKIRPAIAWLCLAGVLLGLLAVTFFSDKTTLVGQVDLKKPDVLAEKASEMIREHGEEAEPRDRAFGFAYTEDRADETPIHFWYRRSSVEFAPQLFAGSFATKGSGRVSPVDPPPPLPDEVFVRLDPQGRLIELRAAGSSHEDADAARARPDDSESRRSAARGLSLAAFHAILVALFATMMVAAAILTRRNLRRGRGDRRGAFRIAMFVFVVSLTGWMLLTSRGARLFSWPVFAMGLQIALFWAFLLWLYYIALEPFVRRVWPRTLISWNRLLAGRFRDPLVGRDLLVGALFGVATRLLWQVNTLAPTWFGLGPAELFGAGRRFFRISLRPLLGTRYCLGEFLYDVSLAVVGGLCVLLFLLLLRLILRKQWAAVTAYITIGIVFWSATVGHPYISWLVAGTTSVLVVILVLRCGLLAVVGYTFVRQILTYPITSDLSAWHAPFSTLFPLSVVLGLAVYCFYLCLDRRSAFGIPAS